MDMRIQKLLAEMTAECQFDFLGFTPLAEATFGIRRYLRDEFYDYELIDNMYCVADEALFSSN